MTTQLKKVVAWRLPVVMAMRGVKSATALQHKLKAGGLDISSAQLSRMMYTRPRRLSTNLLEALTQTLDCEITDLLVLENPGDAAAAPAATTAESGAPKKKARKTPPVLAGNVTGPKVMPFPLPKKKD